MATGADFAGAAPELAARGLARFHATGLALIGTLRRDGSPRISAVEPFIFERHLALGMMYRSMKALDLLRDPRCVVHSTISDKDGTEGEFKVYGRAAPAAPRPPPGLSCPARPRRRDGRRRATNGTCGTSTSTRCRGSSP